MTRKLKKAVKADFGAFVERLQLLPPPPPPPPKAPHPLNGLTFAVSDVFDIDGFVTGFGNPDWSRTHGVATGTSPIVSTLVEGGATCTGKTVVDDMAFSISGENKHYDTPTNPVAPARVPGGSCSGAAVAVAANLVDFSLGIDTVGGVRIPAGYCGLLGFRPSHGSVSHVGIVPVSPSLDTVGWFARDIHILRRVAQLLLQVPPPYERNPRNPRSIIVADDCFHASNFAADRITQIVIKSTERLYGRQTIRHEKLDHYLSSNVPSLKAFHTNKFSGEVKNSLLWALGNVMQTLKRHEFKQHHGEWIKNVKPSLDPAVSTQVREGFDVTAKDVEICQSVRNEMRAAMDLLLKDGGILVIPTTADPAPKLGSRELFSEDYQIRTHALTSLASMSGCCQVVVPLGIHEKCPVSVSFVASHGSDRFLLETIQTMYPVLEEQAEKAAKENTSKNDVNKERSAEIAKEKGNEAFKNKQWQKAIGFYTEAIKLNRKVATYYSNRAAAYLELGSFHQAEADCTEAIDLDKKNVKSYLRRGTAREMLGYYKEAVDDFKHALVLEPNNKRASQSAERLRRLFP